MSFKTATSVVNEASKGFGCAPNYVVTEAGQAPTKQFKVDLYLGEFGPYEGKGPNIKSAKNAAASTALQECTILSKASANKNPVEELNILAMKHGVFLEYKEQRPAVQRPGVKNYENLLLPGYQAQYQSRTNWKISVNILGRTFLGQGKTKKEAKIQAAQNALKALKEEIAKGRITESTKSVSDSDSSGNNKAESDASEKPEIAILYEIVANLQMSMSFTVVEEEGLNHNRKFKIQCQLGDLETIGVAIGKKKAKKEAAAKMLTLVRETEIASALAKVTAKIEVDESEDADKQEENTEQVPTLKWIDKKYRKHKEKKSEGELNVNMDPISYIVHLMQIRKEPPPVFTLIGEQKTASGRAFKMKASVGEHEAFGVASRKKDAKAVAAENLLRKLGIREGDATNDDFEAESSLVGQQQQLVHQPVNTPRSIMSMYRGANHVNPGQQQQQLAHENTYHWVNNGAVAPHMVENSIGPDMFSGQVSYQASQMNDRGVLHRGLVM